MDFFFGWFDVDLLSSHFNYSAFTPLNPTLFSDRFDWSEWWFFIFEPLDNDSPHPPKKIYESKNSANTIKSNRRSIRYHHLTILSYFFRAEYYEISRLGLIDFIGDSLESSTPFDGFNEKWKKKQYKYSKYVQTYAKRSVFISISCK